mmetsp:Transcript_30669/g.5529  ORF Transcript_30669/g.5529 Transcript_30669/m.5529 type:complete len:128 (+) Transcript_30669:600-983(+)
MDRETFATNKIWNVDSTIHNTYADSCKLDTMVQFNNSTMQNFMDGEHSDVLFKMSWTLTPAASCIIDSILPWEPGTLLELAKYGNKALPDFWQNAQSRGDRMGNILIIDNFLESELMEVVLEMNNIS